MLGVRRELWPRPNYGWLVDLYCDKSRGLGRRNFVTLIRVSSQKAAQSQGIFLWGLALLLISGMNVGPYRLDLRSNH